MNLTFECLYHASERGSGWAGLPVGAGEYPFNKLNLYLFIKGQLVSFYMITKGPSVPPMCLLKVNQYLLFKRSTASVLVVFKLGFARRRGVGSAVVVGLWLPKELTFAPSFGSSRGDFRPLQHPLLWPGGTSRHQFKEHTKCIGPKTRRSASLGAHPPTRLWKSGVPITKQKNAALLLLLVRGCQTHRQFLLPPC